MRRESEEGGAGDPETSPPVYLTAIYRREPPRQQLGARCFMVRQLPLPLLHPHLCPKVAWVTLCVHTRHQEHKPEPPHKPPSPCRAVEGNRFSKPEPWLCCWTALRSPQPTTACSAAGSRGGGRNAQSAKVHLLFCFIRGVIGGAADRGVGEGVLVVLFDYRLSNFCCLSGN